MTEKSEDRKKPQGILKEKSALSNNADEIGSILSGSQKRRASVDFADDEVNKINTKREQANGKPADT